MEAYLKTSTQDKIADETVLCQHRQTIKRGEMT